MLQRTTRKFSRSHLREKIRKRMDTVAAKFNIEVQEDWYKICAITTEDSGLFRHCLISLLQRVYPEYEWRKYPMECVASFHLHFRDTDHIAKELNIQRYWNSTKRNREKMDHIASQLKIESQEEWYHQNSTYINHRFHNPLDCFNNSLPVALETVYPEFEWDASKFTNVPKNHWIDKHNQRALMDQFAEDLHIQTQEDWYSITSETLKELRRSSVLGLYNNSLYAALQSVYPEFEWNPVRFTKSPKHHWTQQKHQREYLDWTAEQLNIERQEDWYNVAPVHINRLSKHLRVSSLHHDAEHCEVLRRVYPEYKWHPWLFKRGASSDYWSDISNQKECIEWLGEKLQIFEDCNEWNRISKHLFRGVGGWSLLSYYKDSFHKLLSNVLNSKYNMMSAGQTQVYQTLGSLLKDEHILTNYKFISPHTSQYVELDIYVPSRCLALEYQGEVHYDSTLPSPPRNERDYRRIQKLELCKELGITLLEIPYWCKITPSSIAALIHKIRPDITLPLHSPSHSV